MEVSWGNCVNDYNINNVRNNIVKYLIKSLQLAQIAFCVEPTSSKSKGTDHFFYITLKLIFKFYFLSCQPYIIFMIQSVLGSANFQGKLYFADILVVVTLLLLSLSNFF